MRHLVLDLKVREAHSSNYLVWDVDYRSDIDIDLNALFEAWMGFVIHGGHVVRSRHLPVIN